MAEASASAEGSAALTPLPASSGGVRDKSHGGAHNKKTTPQGKEKFSVHKALLLRSGGKTFFLLYPKLAKKTSPFPVESVPHKKSWTVCP